MFYNAKGELVSVPVSWTNIDEADPFAQVAAGSSWFRTDDLRRLRALVDELTILAANHVK